MSAFYKVMYAQDMMFGGPRVDTEPSQMEAKKVEIQFAIGNDDSSDEGQKAVVDDADKQEAKKEEKSEEGQKADQMKPTMRERSRSKEKEARTLRRHMSIGMAWARAPKSRRYQERRRSGWRESD
jgi:hypothetical protein